MADETVIDRQRVLFAQTTALYAKLPSALVGTPVASGTFVVSLWSVAPHEHLLLWLGVQVMVNVLRALTWTKFGQHVSDNPRRWRQIFLVLFVATGALWGIGAVWFYPPDAIVYQAVIVIFVAGVSATAVTNAQVYPPAVILFVSASVFPLGGRMAIDGDFIHLVMAAMCAVFGLLHIAMARTSARHLIDTLELRVRTDQMASSLEQQSFELERARSELDESRVDAKRLRVLFDRAEVGFLLLECPSFKVVDVSRPALALLELTREQVQAPALTVADLPLGNGLDQLDMWQELLARSEGKRRQRVDTQHTCTDGSTCPLQLAVSVSQVGSVEYMLVLLAPVSGSDPSF